ncbi:MAG TPA: ABC transporter permease [Opitutaceae bacterium]
MPWYLYLALKQLFPTGRRLPFLTVISVVGVALGVALLIIAPGVMGGFGREIQRMVIETQGEVQIRAQGFIDNPQQVLAAVEKVPGVVAATPFAEGVGMVEYGRKPVFPAIQGIDLQRIDRVIPLTRYIRVGSLDDLDDDSVILSSQLAYSIGAGIGSKVAIYSPLLLEKLKSDEVLLPRELTVVGIFEIGHQQLDSSVVLVTLRTMQDLYGLGNDVHGINVKIAAGLDADATARRINDALNAVAPNALAKSWREANQDFLWIVQLEKNLVLFMLLFIVIVAMFLVMSLLWVLVIKKTREIGVLAALGGRSRHVALCFATQGLFIGIFGTLLGLGFGFTALHFRNDLVKAITWVTGGEQALLQFYQFSRLPAYVDPRDLAITIGSAIFMSILAGLLPAWRAARLKPVEALRSE